MSHDLLKKYMVNIKHAHNFLKNRESLRIGKRQKNHELMINRLRKVLSNRSRDYKYMKIWLYGSWSKLGENRFSDIDLALTGKIDFFEIVKLQAEIEKEFQRNADIRSIEELPFKNTILERGIIVYDRENQSP